MGSRIFTGRGRAPCALTEAANRFGSARARGDPAFASGNGSVYGRAAHLRVAVDTFSTPPLRAGGVPGGWQMPYYESVLIARQEIGGGDAERLGEHYEELLSKEGASVVRREYWGLRRLAYRVRKNRKGHYLMFHVDGPGPAIQEL